MIRPPQRLASSQSCVWLAAAAAMISASGAPSQEFFEILGVAATTIGALMVLARASSAELRIDKH